MERLKYVIDKNVIYDSPIFIETGIRFVEDLKNIFGQPVQIFPLLYKSGNKKYENRILIYNFKMKTNISYKGSLSLVLTCLKEANPTLVFDPCVGTGLTARACKRLRIGLICNELNKDRMMKTANILELNNV